MSSADLDGGHRSVVVVGGGQAGLATSHHLVRRGVDHLVLERDRVGHEWRDRRWDSFCLVTPNWQCALPGFPYQGTDPDGFMVQDEIVDYLEKYAASFDVPLAEGVAVQRLSARPGGGYVLATSAGTVTADQVVLATGPYQVPRVPRLAERLPDGIEQVHSAEYRNPEQLPAGAVLVVGTGQSGCQIAEDLHLAGRRVHLATGTAPRVARRYRGRDVVAWLDEIGYYSKGIDEFADVDSVRFRANHYVTGRDGGRDIDLRAFAAEGMRLHGRLSSVRGGRITFMPDLAANLDGADRVSEGIKDSIDEYIAARGIDAPEEARYVPVWAPDPAAAEEYTALDLAAAGVSAVVWCTGFGRDDRWVDVPVFDGRGYPAHDRGVTSAPGLYVVGMPWQWTWGSGRFSGVAADTGYVADRIEEFVPAAPSGADVYWLTGTPSGSYDDDWVAPRTVA